MIVCGKGKLLVAPQLPIPRVRGCRWFMGSDGEERLFGSAVRRATGQLGVNVTSVSV